MRVLQYLSTWLAAGLAVQTTAFSFSSLAKIKVKPYKRAPLQDIVTWDEHTLFVHGERVMFYSGEFHPFRLPVPGLWLDVFQKIRALGYTGVSFYIDWALIEGTQGTIRADGIFALQPFFDAATQAGIYLLARPGPYINAEASGGGFPGWLQRVPGWLRTANTTYMDATALYAKTIGGIIAQGQITNGGPIIMMQPENEYYDCVKEYGACPNHEYMEMVETQFRDAGVVVPFIDNDDGAGNFAPGTGLAAVDIYGIDSYPLGFDCANPYNWPAGYLQTYLTSLHQDTSPSTPYAFVEFQGGSFDPWGGDGFAKCAELLNWQFETVFYKNNFASALHIFSIYMTYGGSNWGNLGHNDGYSSYDYGAAIAEDRTITRQKYSEAKLLANFVQSSLPYLTATGGYYVNGTYTTSQDLATTPLLGNGSATNYYVVRHTAYQSEDTTTYKLLVSTTKGNLTIPQLGGELSLVGRDSKIHTTDYDVGATHVLYSTPDIFTSKTYGSKSILVVYGGPGEQHEMAFTNGGKATVTEGSGVKMSTKKGITILNFQTNGTRKVVTLASGLTVYILDRYTAYNYWVLKLPNERGLFAPNLNATTVILSAGYLMRNATVSGSTLNLVGDFNATTPIEIIGGAPSNLKTLNINGKSTKFSQASNGVVTATVQYSPWFKVPSLSSVKWKYIDSLPEIQASYDDSLWPNANLTKTYNDWQGQRTPTSLFGSDYGFNTGILEFRGHFTATGTETHFFLETQGGYAFGTSVWLNSTYLGSFVGNPNDLNGNKTYAVPKLTKGAPYVLTIVTDEMGMNENYVIGEDTMKGPRGIINYHLGGHPASDIKWKITGNLGGENYYDLVRGPLNEDGIFAERQGYHLPGAPISQWASSGGPTEGTTAPGIAFYGANLPLNIPSGWDVPLSLTLTGAAPGPKQPPFRATLFVNGYQFGKYVNNIGPQTSYPVPQGIWNYQGNNYISMALWSMEAGGSKLPGLELSVNGTILSGYGDVPMAPMSSWTKRAGAY